MNLRLDDLRGPEIRVLLEEHLADMRRISPPESVHALDLEELRRPEISFWTVWEGSELLGCGALKQLDARHGEIKSMRTARAHRGKGVARFVLEHLVGEARRRGFMRLSLETGSQPEFEPARRLYAGAGFVTTGPFAGYGPDPNSTFMTLELREVVSDAEANKALARRWYESVVGEGRVEEVPEVVAPRFVEVHDGVRHLLGVEGARQHVTGVRATYPDLRLTVERQVAEGDWVVSCVTMRGTQQCEWLGIAPTGRAIEVTVVNVDRFENGRLVEHGGAANLLGPLLAIGAVRAVGPRA